MHGKPLVVAWREEDTPEALKAAYQKERESQVRTRLHGLWLLRSGWSLGAVAEALGSHYRSVQRWVAWYREGGVALIRSPKMGGRGQQPFLGSEAQAQVAEVVATGRFRTAGEIREWIAQEYGATYTVNGVYSLLRRLKCAPKVPRPFHSKADIEAQEAWKKGGSRRS